MIARLVFNLNDEDDRRSHLCAVHSEELAIAIWGIRNNLYKKIETVIDNLNLPPEVIERLDPLDEIWRKIEECLPDIDINTLVI